jgi:hypothetical protein
MEFNDGTQPMIWRTREESQSLNHPKLIESMIEEAKQIGYEPMDFNYATLPNIYLRGRYNLTDGIKEWESDGFAMFIKKLEP